MTFETEDWEFVEHLYSTPVGRPKELDDYTIIERVYPELGSKAKMESKKPTRAERVAFIADSFSNFLKWQNCRQ
eukprot:symbB.v1.2.006432.t1/scaffold384.1/size215671/5